MSNGYGTYRVSREANMAAYDRLPPPLRRAVQVAVGPFVAPPILEMHEMGFPHPAIIRLMIRRDREETIMAYGPTHPEANHV